MNYLAQYVDKALNNGYRIRIDEKRDLDGAIVATGFLSNKNSTLRYI